MAILEESFSAVLRCPPLSHTAKQGHDEVVKILGARHDVEVNSKDLYGRSLLFYAARYRAVHNRSQGSIVFPDDHIMSLNFPQALRYILYATGYNFPKRRQNAASIRLITGEGQRGHKVDVSFSCITMSAHYLFPQQNNMRVTGRS